jgi:hypothetical protein
MRCNTDSRPEKMRNPKLRHIFLAFADLLSTLPSPVRSQSACLSLQAPIHKVVYQQPVSINTDVLFNTTFYPLPEAAITVTNAPTSYSGVTTLQWTSTFAIDDAIPQSQHLFRSTAPSPMPTQASDTFVLVALRPQQNQKRQSGSYYVNSDGTITNDCTAAPIYTAKNGVLTATVNGVVYTYSTSAGVGFAPFVPSTVPGSITTAFTIGANAVLQWTSELLCSTEWDSVCSLRRKRSTSRVSLHPAITFRSIVLSSHLTGNDHRTSRSYGNHRASRYSGLARKPGPTRATRSYRKVFRADPHS